MTLPRRPGPPTTVAAATLIAAVALAAALAWIGAQLVDVPEPTTATIGENRLGDFRDATYYPVREFFSGGDPYDPQVMATRWPVRQEFGLYAPFHLLLHAGFAPLPYRPAALLYAAVGAAATVALVAIAVRGAPPRWRPAWVLGGSALLLASYVGEVNVYLGQVNPLLALGAAGALVWRRSRPWLAGALFALAWLKPQFGIPMTVLLVAMGSWRVAARGTLLAGVASLPVVGVLVAREGGLGDFVDVVRRNLEFSRGTQYGATDSFTATRVDVVPVAVRVFGDPALARWELPSLVVVLGLGAVLIAGRRAAPPALLDVTVLLLTMVCIVHQPGDLLAVIPAALAASVAVWPGAAQRLRLTLAAPGLAHGRSRLLLAGALVFLALPFGHQGAIDDLLIDYGGERAAATVDGVLVVMAALLAILGLTQWTEHREPVGRRSGTAA